MNAHAFKATNDDCLSRTHGSILNAAERTIENAVALPPSAYTDADFYNWEVEHIFKKQWLCVGHVSQLPNPGDYFNITLLNEPMVVVCGKDGKVRVLSRVCPHRAMDIIPQVHEDSAKGNRHSFVCPYHNWSFDLNGQLVGAPEMHKSEGFKRKETCLHHFRTEIWEGFIFITFDPNLEPVSQHYAGLLPHVERWNIAQMEMVADLQWDCDFNWKVAVENFIEPYHQLGAHTETLEPIIPAAGSWFEPEAPNYLILHQPLAQEILEQAKAGEANGTSLAALSINAFKPPDRLKAEDYYEYTVYLAKPDLLLAVGSDRVYCYFFLPEGSDKLTLRTTLLVTPESKQLEDYEQILEREIEWLKRIQTEDMYVCTGVQQGLRSSTYSPGPLSHLEMNILLFYRYLASRIRAVSNMNYPTA
jgi:phenylpropionate dioxygenase-like ring-hydroxylating dioxygenase large terminal subunit